MGKSICSYQCVKMHDPKLQNLESVEKCIQFLAFLRLVTQVILPKETLCWLVFNGMFAVGGCDRLVGWVPEGGALIRAQVGFEVPLLRKSTLGCLVLNSMCAKLS